MNSFIQRHWRFFLLVSFIFFLSHSRAQAQGCGQLVWNGAINQLDCTGGNTSTGGTNGVLYRNSTGGTVATATGGAGTLCLTSVSGAAPVWGSCSGTSSTNFSALVSSTNTTAAMVVGTGASLGVSGSGTIAATSVTGFSPTAGKTLTLSNSLTVTATDGSTVVFGTGGTVAYTNVATLSSLASIGTITTGVWNGTVITVPFGGSGAATFTAHGVLLGEGASAHGVTAAGAADTVLQGQGAADPVFAALTSCSAASSALTYNTSTHAFGCNTITGTGATSFPGLTDEQLTVASTTATVAAGACRYGSVQTATVSATLAMTTNAADSGVIRFDCDYNAGTPRVIAVVPGTFIGTYTPTSMTVVTGTTDPRYSIPLGTITITAGSIGAAVEARAAQQGGIIPIAGTNLTAASTNGGRSETLAVDTTIVPEYSTGSGAPASSCTAGRDFYTDTTNFHLYFCKATNTWLQADGGAGANINLSNVTAIAWPASVPLATSSTELVLSETGGNISRLHLAPNVITVENGTVDISSLQFLTSTSNQYDLRYEHRSASLIDSANTAGEFQYDLSGNTWFGSGTVSTNWATSGGPGTKKLTITHSNGNLVSAGNGSFASYSTATNCASSSGACGSAAAGSVSVAAAATTVTVATTAVTANSVIVVTYDASLGTKLSVTCNATEPALYGVTARSAGTSFTITSSAPITNPACFNYIVIN